MSSPVTALASSAAGLALSVALQASAATPCRLRVERVFPKLSFTKPVWAVQPPTDARLWYVVEQAGRVRRVDAAGRAHLALDLTDRVRSRHNEEGLLSLAFHPRYAETRAVFLSYTATGDKGPESRITRVASRADGSFDPASEQVVLRVEQPYGNHNGGLILFGPDGYLYIGFGDGGAAGDPHNHAQNPNTLLGAMLRIDINTAGAHSAYAIPPDNPYAQGGGRPEIFAIGLRNPWRFSFDGKTGKLWAGDVGQDLWEEVDIIERGGNYGWRIREGAHCYEPPACESLRAGLRDPVVEYPHTPDNRSIVGGYVYRGARIPALVGRYLYADTYSGRIFAIAALGAATPELLADTSLFISSFAEGADRELYGLDLAGGGMYRLAGCDGR